MLHVTPYDLSRAIAAAIIHRDKRKIAKALCQNRVERLRQRLGGIVKGKQYSQWRVIHDSVNSVRCSSNVRTIKLTQAIMKKTETKSERWKKQLQSWGTLLAFALVLMLVVEAFLTRETVGTMAPAIDTTTLNGERFSLQQFRGEPAVVHFWATWCPVCELEQGMVNTLANEVPMITVAMQSGTPEEVRDYLKQQGVAYLVVNDERSWFSNQYSVKAVPASFILDSEGRVRFATRGYTTGWGLRIRLWLAGLF